MNNTVLASDSSTQFVDEQKASEILFLMEGCGYTINVELLDLSPTSCRVAAGRRDMTGPEL